MNRFLLLVFCMFFGGCAHHPAPAPFANKTPYESRWWHVFRDPLVDQLVHEMIHNNVDIKIAHIRLEKAQTIHKKALSSLWPDVTIVSKINHIKEGGGSFSYEAQGGAKTLWGLNFLGTAQDVRGAKAQVHQERALWHNTRQIMTRELIETIILFRSLENIIKVKKDFLKEYQRSIEIFQQKARAGLISQETFLRKKAHWEHLACSLSQEEENKKKHQYKAECLLGLKPESLGERLKGSPCALGAPPYPLPQPAFKNIKNRPDIRAAAFHIIVKKAEAAKAEANLWPQLSLEAFFGEKGGTSLTPQNPFFLITSNIIVPFVNFKGLHQAVDLANKTTKEALFCYEKTVLQALKDVHTALCGYRHGLFFLQKKEASYAHYTKALHCIYHGYTHGLVDKTHLLYLQEDVCRSKVALIHQKALTAIAYSRLAQEACF